MIQAKGRPMRAPSAIVLSCVLGIGGCSGKPEPVERSPLADRIGQKCTVQFRRGDALGAGGELPVSPDTDNVNGSEVSVAGTLHAVSDDWIIVRWGDKEYCIPREAVLLVQFSVQQGAK